jgi:hypothetical protein
MLPDDLVETLAGLTPGAASASTVTVLVLGGVNRANGGGGLLRWDVASTATPDGFRVNGPTAVTGAGRWVRVIEGNLVSCKWFGAGLGTLADDAWSDVGRGKSTGLNQTSSCAMQATPSRSATTRLCPALRARSARPARRREEDGCLATVV